MSDQQCSIHGKSVTHNSDMLRQAMQQKMSSTFASAKEKLDMMRSIYPNLIHHCQKSNNFGLLGGILLVEFLTYENGDPVMPGVTASSIVHPPN